MGEENTDQRIILRKRIRELAKKPMSVISTFAALSLLGLVIFNLGSGNLYIARLDYVDATTIIMVAVLILRAVTKLHSASDLSTISIALVSSLSFLYSYEAIYKWSFYYYPWRMPAPELRELVLQIGVGLIILTGFSQQVFKIRRINQIIIGLFVIAWLIWLSVGFPQLWDGMKVHNAIIEIPLNRNMIYMMNRFTKIIWFLNYYYLYV